MKLKNLLFLLALSGGLFMSCSKDNDDEINPEVITDPVNLEVEEFIFAGMDLYYLYDAQVPQLANDDYFASTDAFENYLSGFNSPEDLFFKGLVYEPFDKFSFMTDDYIELEKYFQGTTGTTGMDYGLSLYPDDNTKVLGYVRYVLDGTSADTEGLERGMIFNKVNGTQLNTVNYSDLFNNSSVTLSLATLVGNDVVETGETVTLTKAEYTENPVHIAKTLDVDGTKVGYLMYNSFTRNFDDELNDTFGMFKNEAITELVLDLRYNGGGSVRSAVDLASMITGQFTNEIFAEQQWNEAIQAYYKQEQPEWLYDRFNANISNTGSNGLNGQKINSLNLNKIYIIATRSSASASELVINGLEPYIEVVHVGAQTRGKFQASTTLYDAPNFRRENASPNHKYAIQPLIYKSANADGKSDYFEGLSPDVPINESLRNYGVLGDPSEALLSAAIDAIKGNRKFYENDKDALEFFGEKGMDVPAYQRMYSEKLPALPNR